MARNFTDILKSKGYTVSSKKLGGGYTNDVKLITASREGETNQYVLKRYNSSSDLNGTLRGYDALAGRVNTPTIVYTNKEKREVAYDVIKGKNIKEMVEGNDPEAPQAIRLLAHELERLHNSKRYALSYPKGDSPDERTIRKKSLQVHREGGIDRKELERLQKALREYVPTNRSVIHGDAHLGNFMYTSNRVHIIDTDNVRLSDYNADIGKIIGAIEELAGEGTITPVQSEHLRQLFLIHYVGESKRGVDIHRLRTPLIQTRATSSLRPIHKIREIIAHSLEARVAAGVLSFSVLLVLLVQANLTGNVISSREEGMLSLPVAIMSIIILGILLYFYLQKNKS